MTTPRPLGALAAVSLAAFLAGVPAGACAADPKEDKGPTDSYFYYGPRIPGDPGSLRAVWHPKPDTQLAKDQRLGRDTWIHWTWGNQKVIRQSTVLAGNLPVPVSLDLFRLLDSRNRATRFRDLGLINEPNCEASTRPDKYGLYLDTYKGDKYGYYPISKSYRDKYHLPGPQPGYEKYYPSLADKEDENLYRHYGRPSGVIGLRLFDNPAFKEEQWDLRRYFRNPGKVEPPYLVGFTCGLCHVAFDPLNPPANPEEPRWENLAANIGNQYFREGELMLGKGRAAFGDKHPDPAAPGDPYRTRGLNDGDFIYHYAATQQPGTSETSRISYDFINNPNTINPIYGFKYRPTHPETTPWGKCKDVYRILKDGSDSTGIEWALMRVPINIGCEGNYWVDRLFVPGREQRPFRVGEVLAGLKGAERKAVEDSLGLPLDDVKPERLAELRARYRSPYGKEEFGDDWREAWRRAPKLKAYLLSYEPARLEDVKNTMSVSGQAAKEALEGKDKKGRDRGELRARGLAVFREKCASCHSSKPAPAKADRGDPGDLLTGNFLADDERYRVTSKGLRTNMARALATNAVDHDVWAEFSSRDYKALKSIAPVTPLIFEVPVFPQGPRVPWELRRPIRVEFDPPAGGRGYYRTPSLISMWATAPYLHNNSVGDYWVVLKEGKTPVKGWFPNDGSRIGERRPDGTWVDYRIDVSVEGRLKMFENAMDKLLNPERRRHWVKRTAADCTLLPDVATSMQELIASLARAALRHEIGTWLRDNGVVPSQAEDILQAVEPSLDRALRAVLADGAASAQLAWAAVHLRARDHADRLFELAFDDLRAALPLKFIGLKLPLDRLKLSVRGEFLGRLDRLDRHLREATLLKVPAGTPVNLFANLGPGKLPHALLAHVRHRDDPRALAQALLQMSTCPDFVEDHGHTYGAELPPADKAALIEFLKTL
jgi:mono/diheme cytochrome c family protein